ncbi:MAG TPA: hypothetical protein VMY05_01450 [Acidobacteriota bacterium]|nr:hypothetical protein [Acidobacteriota bacterium]
MRAHHIVAYFLCAGAILLPTGDGLLAMPKCMICHGKQDLARVEETGRRIPLHVDESILKSSVHAARACTDCHVDIVDIPHQRARKVDCRRCHYSGNPVGAPDGDFYDEYEQSVHGLEVLRGNPDAPVCQDCHGTHDVLPTGATESRVYKVNRPRTCGRCHIETFAAYSQSVHGQALQEGNQDSPDCSSCHGEHGIKSAGGAESLLAGRDLVRTCSGCHGSKGVGSKYGIESDRVSTYEHSFHGVATALGNRTVANCGSCHGYHDIHPDDDPRSSVHPDNIVKTCGKPECHPEASPRFASGRIHIDPTSKKSGILYYITRFFTILTVSTLGGLFLFIILDLFRRAKASGQKGK